MNCLSGTSAVSSRMPLLYHHVFHYSFSYMYLLKVPWKYFVEKQRCDVVRTEPYLVDVDGRVFWKLKGYNNGDDMVLQGHFLTVSNLLSSVPPMSLDIK